ERIDDSVFTIFDEKPYPVRRARGYAPNPIRLINPVQQVLAVGPQMKNTICLTREKYAFLSHYIGEMENWETYQDFKSAIEHYQSLFRITPEVLAHDLHPDYLSTQYALERAEKDNLPVVAVQHHHAHLAAVAIENQIPPAEQVIGLIFDGTGYGTDGTIWGGEVLVGNCDSFTRPYHLQRLPLPGGEVTIHKPARMALSLLWALGMPWDDALASVQALSPMERDALHHQLEHNVNVPQTSSMGRLFDAISALLGIRQEVSYEGQAAIELEALAQPEELGYYSWQVDKDEIMIAPLISAILEDIKQEIHPAVISAKFHNTLAHIGLDLVERVHNQTSITKVALSGGVWQNLRLLATATTLLEQHGFQTLIHRQTPPNDGCVAFGQAMIAAYRYSQQKE
ncbi:MAG: carbamoyltransferase HypF, partial [Anaerolineaceae bacterium]|nr:carbamoyltransferase HypF [Anaerolineaceae bacterium]